MTHSWSMAITYGRCRCDIKTHVGVLTESIMKIFEIAPILIKIHLTLTINLKTNFCLLFFNFIMHIRASQICKFVTPREDPYNMPYVIPFVYLTFVFKDNWDFDMPQVRLYGGIVGPTTKTMYISLTKELKDRCVREVRAVFITHLEHFLS